MIYKRKFHDWACQGTYLTNCLIMTYTWRSFYIQVSFVGSKRKGVKFSFLGGYSFKIFAQNTDLIHPLMQIFGHNILLFVMCYHGLKLFITCWRISLRHKPTILLKFKTDIKTFTLNRRHRTSYIKGTTALVQQLNTDRWLNVSWPVGTPVLINPWYDKIC